MMMLSSCMTLALLAWSGAVDEDAERAAMTQGRLHTQQFFQGDDEPLWESFDTGLRALMGGSMATLATFRLQVDGQLGPETVVISETTTFAGDQIVYLRKARFEKLDQTFDVVFSFNSEGAVSGFTIRPEQVEAPSKYLDYVTKTKLRLPFNEAWTVFWGGRTLDLNYHTAYADQRFAYDILIIKDGVSHTGDSKALEDYYCFDLPLIAPGAGVVIAAENGVADNVPGEMNPAQALGNHVIIDHENGEYSFLAHFKKGTVAVAVGDKVAIGTLLGHCGNSGNTSEPHVHYHLQDTALFGKGQGLPAPFVDYIAAGEPVALGEPLRLQVVSNR